VKGVSRFSLFPRNVTDLPPLARGTAMIFQDYAPFPHINCLGNVAFGFRMRGVGRAERHDHKETNAQNRRGHIVPSLGIPPPLTPPHKGGGESGRIRAAASHSSAAGKPAPDLASEKGLTSRGSGSSTLMIEGAPTPQRYRSWAYQVRQDEPMG
jgi:hypothetical protein